MYNYQNERKNLFTEKGQMMFIAIRDKAKGLLKVAGAFMLIHVISGVSGDSFTMFACVDRLVELGEIKEITTKDTPGQFRVFIET